MMLMGMCQGKVTSCRRPYPLPTRSREPRLCWEKEAPTASVSPFSSGASEEANAAASPGDAVP